MVGSTRYRRSSAGNRNYPIKYMDFEKQLKELIETRIWRLDMGTNDFFIPKKYRDAKAEKVEVLKTLYSALFDL